jgi:hypothetical protein
MQSTWFKDMLTFDTTNEVTNIIKNIRLAYAINDVDMPTIINAAKTMILRLTQSTIDDNTEPLFGDRPVHTTEFDILTDFSNHIKADVTMLEDLIFNNSDLACILSELGERIHLKGKHTRWLVGYSGFLLSVEEIDSAHKQEWDKLFVVNGEFNKELYTLALAAAEDARLKNENDVKDLTELDISDARMAPHSKLSWSPSLDTLVTRYYKPVPMFETPVDMDKFMDSLNGEPKLKRNNLTSKRLREK